MDYLYLDKRGHWQVLESYDEEEEFTQEEEDRLNDPRRGQAEELNRKYG